MNPTDIETTLKFMIDRLDPSDRSDLEALLSAPVDSVAQDVMNGRLKVAVDAMPELLKRQIRARTRPDHSSNDAAYSEMFPNSARLR